MASSFPNAAGTIGRVTISERIEAGRDQRPRPFPSGPAPAATRHGRPGARHPYCATPSAPGSSATATTSSWSPSSWDTPGPKPPAATVCPPPTTPRPPSIASRQTADQRFSLPISGFRCTYSGRICTTAQVISGTPATAPAPRRRTYPRVAIRHLAIQPTSRDRGHLDPPCHKLMRPVLSCGNGWKRCFRCIGRNRD